MDDDAEHHGDCDHDDDDVDDDDDDDAKHDGVVENHDLGIYDEVGADQGHNDGDNDGDTKDDDVDDVHNDVLHDDGFDCMDSNGLCPRIVRAQ